MPRSGTTLLEAMLTMSSDVVGAGESMVLRHTVQQLAHEADGQDLRDYTARLRPPRWDELGRTALHRYREEVGCGSRIVDKMLFNYERLDLIARLFPGSRTIVMLRDPLDAALSCYFTNFDTRLPFTRRLRHLGLMFRRFQELVEAASALPLSLHLVRYQDLVAEPEATLQQVFRFIGVPYTTRALAFHSNPRTFNTASQDQVRRPLYTTSVGRWRHYSHHLEPLRTALR